MIVREWDLTEKEKKRIEVLDSTRVVTNAFIRHCVLTMSTLPTHTHIHIHSTFQTRNGREGGGAIGEE